MLYKIHNLILPMNASIFKAYDIRGLANKEINASMARRLGKILSELYSLKHVLVGRDMRETSLELEESLIDGFQAAGVDVTLIGLCSTPVFNMTLGEAEGKYDLGVMVTASHNPAEYNGFKITRGDCLPIGKNTGMEDIKARCLSEEPIPDQAKRGAKYEDKEAIQRYIKKILSIADLPPLKKPLRICLDGGNGMNGIVTPRLLKEIKNLEVFGMYLEPDGNFPNHEANPLKVETLKDLQANVKKYEAAFGVAFDGDGDRVGFVDEQAEPIPGDILTAMFAGSILEKQSGGIVLYDVRSSWSVPEFIREKGGEPHMCPVGHAIIKQLVREQQALFAGELSMHFYFKETYGCESTDLALLLMMKLAQQAKAPLSSLWKSLQRYVHSGEHNFKVQQPLHVIDELSKRYQAEATRIIKIDGVRLEFRYSDQPERDWWFCLRASNTEPLLRLNVEARTKELMQSHLQELTTLIEGYGGTKHS